MKFLKWTVVLPPTQLEYTHENLRHAYFTWVISKEMHTLATVCK